MNERTRRAILTIVFAVGMSLLLVGVYANAEPPKEQPAATPNPASDLPDMVTIESIKNIYEGVDFTHKGHFESYGLDALGCADCHHHGPQGVYPACSECHSKSGKVEGVQDRTSLRAAYHKQCGGCHKINKCADCHTKAKKPAKTEAESK
ncbi:MAG TPA: cytochrome c3 family protein [bacterium]|nr:cytochrome c3 family protein [bacterium]